MHFRFSRFHFPSSRKHSRSSSSPPPPPSSSATLNIVTGELKFFSNCRAMVKWCVENYAVVVVAIRAAAAAAVWLKFRAEINLYYCLLNVERAWLNTGWAHDLDVLQAKCRVIVVGTAVAVAASLLRLPSAGNEGTKQTKTLSGWLAGRLAGWKRRRRKRGMGKKEKITGWR